MNLVGIVTVELRQCVGLVELSLEHNKLVRPLLDFRSFCWQFFDLFILFLLSSLLADWSIFSSTLCFIKLMHQISLMKNGIQILISSNFTPKSDDCDINCSRDHHRGIHSICLLFYMNHISPSVLHQF